MDSQHQLMFELARTPQEPWPKANARQERNSGTGLRDAV